MPESVIGWFKDVTKRDGPNTPSDFNLFAVPRHPLQEWAKQISSNPQRVRCTVLSISQVSGVTRTLYEAITHDHGLTTAEAVGLFDEYLGAACPKCFAGLTGSLIQTVSSSSRAAGVIGGGEQFQRILSRRSYGTTPG